MITSCVSGSRERSGVVAPGAVTTPVVAAIAAVTKVERGHHEKTRVGVDVVIETVCDRAVVSALCIGVNVAGRSHVVQRTVRFR